MKHLLGCLLLSSLCCLSSWGTSGALVVTQSPREVTVQEGDTVQIQCCWNQNFTRATLQWLKEKEYIDTTISSKTNRTDLIKSLSDGHNQCQPLIVCNCSSLTLSNITRKDSGLYTCKLTIEIPRYHQLEGGGTKIIVTTVIQQDTTNDRKEPDREPLSPIVIPLAVLSGLLLVALIFFMVWQKQRGRHLGRADSVIYEVPNHRSTVLETVDQMDSDGSSNSSSRGSTQWCQVQLYESVAYFAVENNKDSQDKE